MLPEKWADSVHKLTEKWVLAVGACASAEYTSAMIVIPPSLIQQLKTARHVVVLTGAGTSAESGVPTFREAQTGLWAQYDPAELATPDAFAQRPDRAWDWYAWRRELVSQAQPNAGHVALAELANWVPRLTLITQNVDGLHQQAGSQDVVELHGNIGRIRCSQCDAIATRWDADAHPPRCARCDAYLRPDVVWFGENLPADALDHAIEATLSCDLFFSIGTSSLVYPAAALPLEALKRNSAVVEINVAPTPLSAEATHVLTGPSGEVLPALLTALRA